MTRAIPTSMAGVIQQLELDGDVIVTLDRLTELLSTSGRNSGREQARELAYELQKSGWLGPLRTRGAWEFLPGARGGAYGSGDRFIEFRAQEAVNPAWSGALAMESAASLLGLAQRVPKKEVLALPAAATSQANPFPSPTASSPESLMNQFTGSPNLFRRSICVRSASTCRDVK